MEVDKNGIDIAFSCTQKGMSCPPGLAPVTVSPRALDRLRAREAASRYLVSRSGAARRVL